MISYNKNQNPRSYIRYRGNSSHGNPNLEIEPADLQGIPFNDLIESVSQPTQHYHVNSNPIMALSQPRLYTFDFMSCNREVQEEGSNINNVGSKFPRPITILTNNGLHQELPPNGTITEEGNVDATPYDI
ncbi:hypothetical protein V5N11_003191 [Cardamine amara subsp. amara]|uniref:Uncharacterized protein n=1 Tax=Cardamine amara subsp. amara TaxID=228776 RepID=A0ABD0ZH53_CARAN